MLNICRYLKAFYIYKKTNINIFLEFHHYLFGMPKIIEIGWIFHSGKRKSQTTNTLINRFRPPQNKEHTLTNPRPGQYLTQAHSHIMQIVPQICDFLQLDKVTKNVYSHYTKFFFSISIFYDGALPPVLTRHWFTIFVLKSVKHSISMAYILKKIRKKVGFLLLYLH